MIIWRMDDFGFSACVENGPMILGNIRRVISVFERFGIRLSLGLITRYEHVGHLRNKEMLELLRDLAQRGHLILAHGAYHNQERPYTDMSEEEIKEELRIQKQDFGEMGLPFKWLCYPFNHRSAFSNAIVTSHGLRIIQEELSSWMKISTVTKWKNPDLSEQKLQRIVMEARAGKRLMVEDHIWLYQKEDHFEMLLDCLGRLTDIPFTTAEAL